jgi:ATP-dependent protease ClpP protease subunit
MDPTETPSNSDFPPPLPIMPMHPHSLIGPALPDPTAAHGELTASQLAELRYRTAIAESAEIDVAIKRRNNAVAAAADSENKTYMFFSGTTGDPIKKAIEDLTVLSRRFPGEPLTIVLNSPGGNVIHGLALYDHIRSLSKKGHFITMVVRGMAASMGGILLQAGDWRVVGSEAEILIHIVSSAAQGPLYTMEDSMEFSQRLWMKLSKILARRSKLTAKQVRAKAARKDWWFNANTAVKLGFADEIG